MVGKLSEILRLDRDPNVPKLNLGLLRKMWELTVPYWKRPGAWTSYVVIAIYTAYTFGNSLISARLAKFAGDQLDTLSRHDSPAFYRLLLLSLLTQLAISLVSIACSLPFSIMIQRWRQWLTERFIQEYLQDSNYYALNRDRAVDNPDERMAIDIAQFVNYPTTVLFGLLECLSNLTVFGYILWSFGWYLVPACAIYYIIYSLVTLLFSKPILNLSYAQRRLDGDFRFSLVNLRVNAESVAFLRGEPVEKRELFGRLHYLVQNFIKTAWWNSIFTTWLTFASGLSTLLPALFIAPLVLRGTFSISAFTQTQNAWSQLGTAFGFIGDQALFFAYGGALIARLHTMHEHMVGKSRTQLSPGHNIRTVLYGHLEAKDFNLSTPDGKRVLVADLSFALARGSLLITGPNGVGKSSLLRGLAGLWTRGSGELRLPPRERMMFLPQRPYMSLGTLREQLTYPQPEESIPENAIREVLAKVQLGHLEERFGGFGSKLDWTHVLSPGEQQRLAFGRVLLRRSDLVILDEATSAIDVEGEQSLYGLLQQMGSTYLSVAHRVSLYPFHDRMLELKGGGAWEIKPIEHAR
jgi:putative ATP-binding cassette transporter